jgi:hypothetical protein
MWLLLELSLGFEDRVSGRERRESYAKGAKEREERKKREI